MKDKKLPQTSLDAYKSVPDEMKERHHSKILNALKELKLAIGEEIALKVGMDKHQIGRRLSELERDQLIYKPGSKKNTSTGRQAFQYALTGMDIPEIKKVESVKNSDISTADYASKIINMSYQNKNGIQSELF